MHPVLSGHWPHVWPPLWPSAKVSASRASLLGSIPAFRRGSVSRGSHTGDLKISTPGASLLALDVRPIGSALGLVGAVSVN